MRRLRGAIQAYYSAVSFQLVPLLVYYRQHNVAWGRFNVPDYRAYTSDGKGGLKELSMEGLAKFLGISDFDANLMIKGWNITKAICTTAGMRETPPLVWNQNMPEPLVEFVTEHVFNQLQANPAWEVGDFDWSLLYDGDNLKYK